MALAFEPEVAEAIHDGSVADPEICHPSERIEEAADIAGKWAVHTADHEPVEEKPRYDFPLKLCEDGYYRGRMQTEVISSQTVDLSRPQPGLDRHGYYHEAMKANVIFMDSWSSR